MQKIVIIILLLICSQFAFSQNVTISGYVENKESNERLIGALVYNAEVTRYTTGTMSNEYGFFSLTIPKGYIKLAVSYVGFTALVQELFISKDTFMNIKLIPNTEIEKVIITGSNKVESSQMSQVDIPLDIVRKMPVLLGEVDVLKTIQLLPGVQSGTEGSSGIYVRGGGPDQNLILLDGVPVYNVNHMFGFFSVFNGYAINDISLIKGGFPARYGGRLSSVIDIHMKEGNMQRYTGEVSVGIIASKFTIEGPIKKNKASFIISGRRTYYDLLTAPIIALAAKLQDPNSNIGAGYFFYDLNAKVNYKFSDNDRIYLSGYFGKDKAYINESSSYSDNSGFSSTSKLSSNLNWGNATAAARWNHIFTPKLFANTTLTYSNYRFATEVSEYSKQISDSSRIEQSYGVKYLSGIEDWAGKIDFDYSPSVSHKIKFGASAIYHTFKPGVSVFSLSEGGIFNIDTTFGNKNIIGMEYGLYAEVDFSISRILKINGGVRATALQLNDTTFYSIEPRLSMRILVNNYISVKASYAQMTQYLHFLTNSTIGLPTDLWLPATKNVVPEKSTQYAAGAAFNITANYEFSIEGFYKEMKNLIEYKEGESFFSSAVSGLTSKDSWEDKVEVGNGESYGCEFFLQKKYGKLTGWVGYTISWSWRQFENISFGQKFPYRYDRRHDISVLLIYKLNENIDFGATWVYGTGNAVTLAQQKYLSFSSLNDPYAQFNGYNTIEYYGTRNNYRMPAYHRLDLGVNFNKKLKRGIRTWSISFYNAYNRQNPFFVQFETKYNSNGNPVTKLYQYSLFPLIPSISYSFKFN